MFVAPGNFVASLSCVSAFSKDVFISPGGKEEEDEEVGDKTSRRARELISRAANSRGRWSEPR